MVDFNLLHIVWNIFLEFGVKFRIHISTLSVILEKTIRIPRSLSVKAASILKGFLNKVWFVFSFPCICIQIKSICQIFGEIIHFSKKILLAIFQSPQERLGCHPQTGFADIQSHPFFRTIDWDMLYEKQITPPHKPLVRSDRDLEHFDPQFTNEPVQLTPDDQ